MDGLRKQLRPLESWILSPSVPPRAKFFQYMSDLHLEVGQQYLTFDFEPKAPTLILAGDIGRLIDYDGYLAFLQKQTARFQRVFLVLGNHEFYGLSSFESGVACAREPAKEPSLDSKLFLLHQNKFSFPDDEDIILLGCPLWSLISEDAAHAVAAVVNDFKKIEGWSIEKHNAAHIEDLEWLRQEVQTSQRDRSRATIIVVTHHAPFLDNTASPQHKDSPIKTAFATEACNVKEQWALVKYWVFGHTHWTTQFKAKGIQVVSNQRGYVFPGNNVRLVVEPLPLRHTFNVGRTIHC